MLVTGFPAGMFQTNCYVIAHDDARECVVVDPGQDAAEPLMRFLDESNITPVAILLTHGHLDHTWSVEPLCRTFDIPAYIHTEDRYMLSDPLRGTGPTLAALLGDAEFSEPDEVRGRRRCAPRTGRDSLRSPPHSRAHAGVGGVHHRDGWTQR